MHHTQKFCQISFPSKIYTFYACTFQSKVNDFEFGSKYNCDEPVTEGASYRHATVYILFDERPQLLQAINISELYGTASVLSCANMF